MRKVTYLCDICGAETEEMKTAEDVPYFKGCFGELRIAVRGGGTSADICPACRCIIQTLFCEFSKKKEN